MGIAAAGENLVAAAAVAERGRAARAALLLLLLAASALRVGAAEPLEVVVSDQGFRPSVVHLRRGETVRVSLRSADGEHCFAVDALRIEKRVRPGRPTSVDLTPDRVGRLPFHDCLRSGPDIRSGELVVAE
jgi:heme/copper-type cytochrome/quinol oxidase subunit 2